jgi:N-acyl-D-aspartate/D-glutamate deacylase
MLLLASLLLAQANFDLILRNGRVIDGTGRPAITADVAVRDGVIRHAGKLPKGAKATVDLDVRGLTVAPGFINIHSHATPSGVATAVNMLTQGVTTEIINADGGGARSVADQLKQFSANGLAVNLGAYIGFNYVWGSTVGNVDRRPTPDEVQKMRDLITQNLKEGAWGVSAGLDYKPGYFATTQEVIAVTEAARAWHTNFPNHDRLRPEQRFSSLAAIAETIEIATKAGMLPVITHMKVQGREQGKADQAVAMLRNAGAVADIYPYLAGQTRLGALFVPAWAVAGGNEAMLQRFADPVQRARIAKEIEEAIEARILTAENIDIPSKKRRFSDYMREYGTGPGETMIRILEKEHPSAIMKFGAEADLVKLLQYEGSAVSCDCGASEEVPGMHPRYFGTFPRVLGHYSRDTHAMTLEDAVRKMSGLPAAIVGMVDRGYLKSGMAADIAVFDASKIIDHATYENPAAPSTGMVHVAVNGKLALRDGKPVKGVQAGSILKRAANSTSRNHALKLR